MVKNLPCNAGYSGLIPDQGTEGLFWWLSGKESPPAMQDVQETWV